MPFASFQPPRRILMGPGPSDVPVRILEAVARPTIGHLDPAFITMMDEIKAMLQQAFRTGNELTFVVSGPGTAGMETCFANLVEPGDHVIVYVNGYFGNRMREMVERYGGTPIALEGEWGRPADPRRVHGALQEHPEAKAVAFVHAETSTGALSDAAEIVKLCRQSRVLSIVDAVTSLGGLPVDVDGWGVDAIYSGSQKCLSCVPGLSPVSFGPRALDRLKSRRRKVQSWFLDLTMIVDYWSGTGKRAYHHTAPINSLYGFHEALVMLHEEGLENAWARHRRVSDLLRNGLQRLGLQPFVPESERIPQLTAVRVPDGVDEAAVRTALLEKYGIEIGAGLGPLAGKIWRIGLMGHSCREENVELCLGALRDELRR
ncbi:MAG: alanine--glyoxylate aminotransferase family protein [Candidatus Krumholzibacteriia bacterium]